jgi:hypothetical protein
MNEDRNQRMELITQSAIGNRLITLFLFLVLLYSPSVFAQSSFGAGPGLSAQPGGCTSSGISLLKGNGTGGCSNAVAGTDYVPPTTGNAVQKANGSGGLTGTSWCRLRSRDFGLVHPQG